VGPTRVGFSAVGWALLLPGYNLPDRVRKASVTRLWAFDLHGVGDFSLMYYLGKGCGVVTNIPYPQADAYPLETQVPYALANRPISRMRRHNQCKNAVNTRKRCSSCGQ